MRCFYCVSIFVCVSFHPSVVGFSNHGARHRQSFAPVELHAVRDREAQSPKGSLSRRTLVQGSFASLGLIATGNFHGGVPEPTRSPDGGWVGTTLPLLSLDDAYQLTQEAPNDIFPFAQWPDPILRRPAARLSLPAPGLEADFVAKIQSIARTLQRTAHQKGAVGLAAQQCGIDVSLVYLQTHKPLARDEGLFLLNPRIVRRSPERDMLVWTEECLVLPPSFRITLLRDAAVTVEYEAIFPTQSGIAILSTQQVALSGELARAVQHEMQHDRGVLIVDHLELEELPEYMQGIEAEGHRNRMVAAFDRSVGEPPSSLLAIAESKTSWQADLIPRANAAEMDECDETCIAERKRIIEERRAMMRQSRTNTRRQDVFELSRQRAAMYNTTNQGAQCPPGIPCI
jgi:peptide deformylase